MIFFGLDPGTTRVGYGVVRRSGARLEYLAADILNISESLALPERLVQIERALDSALGEFRPDLAAVETLFFTKNKKTAIEVAEGRGIIIMTLAKRGVPFVEFSPSAVKAAVSGDGKASKEALAKMVWLTLQMERPSSKLVDDATDALALAIAGSLHYTALA